MVSRWSFRDARGSSGTPVAAAPQLGFQKPAREMEQEQERGWSEESRSYPRRRDLLIGFRETAARILAHRQRRTASTAPPSSFTSRGRR
jgi:hypothetical protein